MVNPVTPTRNQISKMAQGNPDLIKAMEQLFTVAGTDTPAEISSITALVENAAYSAAISSKSHQQNSLKIDYLDFRRLPNHSGTERSLLWNNTYATLALGMDYGISQKIGFETYVHVENNTGLMIPNGAVVGISGSSSGDAISVSPYLADGSQPSLNVLGVMNHDLPENGKYGYCTNFGFVRGINTSGFSVGDFLYSSTTVSGAFTVLKPTSPNSVVQIAICLVSDASDGVIFVRPNIEQIQYYGAFSKTTSENPSSSNTAYEITFDNTEISNGVTIGSPTSQIIVPASGLYKIEANVKIISGNSSKKDVYVWLKKNGTDIPNTTRIITIDIKDGYINVALTETLSLEALGYIEMAYAANSNNITIESVSATAFSPASPSAVIRLTQVQQ